jgi:hypothetical protein
MDIPTDRLSIRFSRSGGPGGQNVNKVETKAEVRLHLATAEWIPAPIRERIQAREQGRINSRGELVLTSSRFRTRLQNLEDCLAKLRSIIEAASRRPRRRIGTRPTKASRERRLAEKHRQSTRKQSRRGWEADRGAGRLRLPRANFQSLARRGRLRLTPQSWKRLYHHLLSCRRAAVAPPRQSYHVETPSYVSPCGAVSGAGGLRPPRANFQYAGATGEGSV